MFNNLLKKKTKTEAVAEPKVMTANKFTNVKDIKNNILYTKDDYIMGYLRIYPYNIDLLSEEDKKSKTNQLTAQFKGNDLNFTIFSLPREVDIDNYKSFLERKYQEEVVYQNKKLILSLMIRRAIELSTLSENYEHQIFLKVWKKNESGARKELLIENEIRSFLNDLKQYYASVKIQCEILEENKILELCNLFANGIKEVQIPSNQSISYTPHTILRDF